LGQFPFGIATRISPPIERLDLPQHLLRVEGVDDRLDLLLQFLLRLLGDQKTLTIPLEGAKMVLELNMIVAQQGEDLDHPGRSEEGRKELVENPNGILGPLQLSVTEPHPELGFVDQRTFREIGGQLLETPEGSLCVALGEQGLSVTEEDRIIRL
jgi:hypothetical protein